MIHPPVDVSAGKIGGQEGGAYYIAIGRLVEYKRFDLAIAACTQLRRAIEVIGAGPQEKAVRRLAGPTVEILGRVSDAELRENLAGCRALLFPGEEDFGIVPVEAQSFGKPVIAYASGGALETVRGVFPNGAEVENSTGVFFKEKSLSGLTKAILQFEAMEHKFRPEIIRRHSLQFDSAIFKRRISEFIASAVRDFRARNQADICVDKVFDAFAGA